MTSAAYPAARPTGVCAATGRSLAPGEAYVATFIEHEGRPGIERQDFSIGAWESGARPAPPAYLLGHWRATFTPREPARRPMMGDAELLDLFEELAGAAEPRRQSFRYFVALLLVRRRVLRVVGRKDGALLLMPRGGVADPVAVADPGLDESAIEGAMEQLGRVLSLDAGQASEGA